MLVPSLDHACQLPDTGSRVRRTLKTIPMSDPTETISTSEAISASAKKKLESSSEHARRAWEATTQAAKHVGDTVKKEAQAVISSGKDHLGKAAQNLSEAASDACGTLRSQASQKIHTCREQTEAALGEASAKVKTLQSNVEDYVHSHPLKSIGIAAGIGFVLGFVLWRR
jgi:ElaB/YqjD/DUF883 family membrane-anchored ribosome-binding protein